MSYVLEQTDAAAVALDDVPDLSDRLQAVGRAPHPWLQVFDEWGNLLRVEGICSQYFLHARSVTAEGVRWLALGQQTGPTTKVALHLPGRVVKVAPHERMDIEMVERVFGHVLEHGALPEDLAQRPLDGNHGRLFMLVLQDGEPRPAMGWTDIARQITDLPADGPVVGALAEPGRLLVGIFGEGDRISLRVRESRGEASWERTLRRVDGGRARVQVELPHGTHEVEEAELFSRADALIVLESLYRFDVPPPGYAWSLARPRA